MSAAAGDKKDDVSEQSDGMAAALQRALMQRNMKISGGEHKKMDLENMVSIVVCRLLITH